MGTPRTPAPASIARKGPLVALNAVKGPLHAIGHAGKGPLVA